MDSGGRVTTEVRDVSSYLLGLRYLTQGNTTYIAEYYANGAGYSEREMQAFFDTVDAATADVRQSPLFQRVASLSQSAYGRPNVGKRYLYLRAQQKDAFGVVYFQPAVTAMANVEDGSFQVTPELFYTGVNNLELRLRWFVLAGGSGTDFGEKQNRSKLELRIRYYF